MQGLYDEKLLGHEYGFNLSQHQVLCDMVRNLKEEIKDQKEVNRIYGESIRHLTSKFSAINEHYGITVEREEAKYTVKEIK